MSGRGRALRAAFLVVAGLALGTSLGSCGKKPGFPDPPEGADPNLFPRGYPSGTLDPKPRGAPGAAAEANPPAETPPPAGTQAPPAGRQGPSPGAPAATAPFPDYERKLYDPLAAPSIPGAPRDVTLP